MKLYHFSPKTTTCLALHTRESSCTHRTYVFICLYNKKRDHLLQTCIIDKLPTDITLEIWTFVQVVKWHSIFTRVSSSWRAIALTVPVESAKYQKAAKRDRKRFGTDEAYLRPVGKAAPVKAWMLKNPSDPDTTVRISWDNGFQHATHSISSPLAICLKSFDPRRCSNCDKTVDEVEWIRVKVGCSHEIWNWFAFDSGVIRGHPRWSYKGYWVRLCSVCHEVTLNSHSHVTIHGIALNLFNDD